MPRRFSRISPSLRGKPIKLERVLQISESHCGPAVVQMLLANLGIGVSQEQVAEAGGATELIELHGMRVDQLALAVKLISPAVTFWFKQNSRLRELIALVTRHRYPVGVEWQGLFEDDESSETEDADYGHYSVVTHVDLKRKELIIADPYKDFVDQDRIFSLEFFARRWWDTNEITDPTTGRTELVEDYHMMFIITPAEATFPAELGMIAAR
jgi:hypothetical protein